MKISITIPAYNEEERIGKTLEAYSTYFSKIPRSELKSYELLIVINNTKDNTQEVVKSYQKKNKNIKYLNFKQGGKGFAVLEGFKHALKDKSTTHIGFVDADLATDPESFYLLTKEIKSQEAAIANRYLPDSKITPKLSFRRTIMASVFNLIVRSLFLMPYTDTQCGAKLFSRKATKIIVDEAKLSQWAFDVELLYKLKKKGIRAEQVRTNWIDIDGSKINVIRSPIQMLLAILQLRVTESRFKRLLRPIKPLISWLYKLSK